MPIRVKNTRDANIIDKKLSLLALVFVTVQILNNSILPMIIGPLNIVLQVMMYTSFIAIIGASYPKIQIEPKSILLILATVVSLIVNQTETKYGSEIRWILWVLLLGSVGPLLSSSILLKIRYKILRYFMYGFMIATILSFVYLLLGLEQIGRGNFSGVMNQSMVLGPVAAISGIYAFYKFLINHSIKRQYLFLAISAISGLLVIVASSRLAFAGYIAGMIIMFAKPFRNRIYYSLIFLTIGLAIFSRIDDGADKVEKSIDKGLIEKGTNNSRETLWNDRIREFEENKIFGVGFSAQKDELLESENPVIGGRIEPGSGYLMILSMTGIYGLSLILYFLSFILNNRNFWREIYRNESYKLSIFAFFVIHFIGEGYIYSAGSMLNSLFWLMIGITYPYANILKRPTQKKIKKYKHLKKALN